VAVVRHHLPYVGVIVLSPEQVNVEIYSTVELSICVSNPQENNTYFLIRVNPDARSAYHGGLIISS
jgi:hypothetical protein